jgi:hypothetical protein
MMSCCFYSSNKQRRARLITFHLFVSSLVLACCLASSAQAADDAPPWLRQATTQIVPPQDKGVPAVVLLSEQSIRVEDNGRVTTLERGAIKILKNEGKDEASTAVVYLKDTGKVKDFRAWLIRPSGDVKKYGKDQILDVSAAQNDVYDEVRAKVVSAESDAEPGAIFGYEWTTEDRSVFTQFDWVFQEQLPTQLSRFTITLPEGWRAEGVMFNRPKIAPQVNGSSYTWELRDLPYITWEPSAPAFTNIAPRLAVSYFPAGGAKSEVGPSFDSWSAVSKWLTSLSEGQAALDDALAGKARQLTANSKTEMEKIQAIGRFAQSINYISIQTGIGRGGGYRPHSAIEVFAKAYGDCKDKANLMRAMLRAINITSYLVCIYSGDPTYVREDWPSPQQFNHCIIAVKVSDETQAATIVKHPTIGRLLIFDPTDDTTPVGDLPDHEQGSFALIIAGEDGALLRMPETPSEANSLERETDVVLLPDGTISVKLRERSIGQSAVNERRGYKGLPKPDYVKLIEKWITRNVTGAAVSKVEPVDNPGDGRFALDVEFSAERYGQLMAGRLLVFKPAIVSRQNFSLPVDSVRRHSVVLDPRAYSETVKVKLPDGFAVDEIPDAVKLNVPFGSYTTSYEIKDGHLHFKRSLIVRSATIPAGEYDMVRKFFGSVLAADQSPVVLVKK